MTTRALLYVGLLLAVAPAAAAEGVSVTAGEHAGYSRIVVAGAEAAVTQSGRSVGVHFDQGADAAIDLSDINARRKAHRVAAATLVETGAGPLIRLSLACDCAVTTRRLANGKLVIDIADAPGEAVAALPVPPQKPAPARAAPAGAAPTAQTAIAADPVSVDEARARMLKLLQQAADEGFVTVKENAAELTPRSPEPLSAALAPSGPSIDAPQGPQPRREATAAPSVCLPDGAFAIDGSAIEDSPLVGLGELQTALAEASPEDHAGAAERLAIGYLAVGFGEEALAVLEDAGAETSLYTEIARILADNTPLTSGSIMSARDCRGAHALWQAAGGAPSDAAAAAARAGRAIDALPTRLRAEIAARIAIKLVETGDYALAKTYYMAASDASPTPTADLQFIAAKLLESEGSTETSDEMLRDLATGNSAAAKNALIALADRYEDEGAQPHEGFAEEIGALAVTDQGTALGGQAAFREATMWAGRGDVEAAVLLLRNAGESDPAAAATARGRATDALKSAFASGRPEQSLAALAAYLEHRAFIDAAGADLALVDAAARAAAELGAPNAGLKLLEETAALNDQTRASLAARVALAADAPEDALAHAAPYADNPDFAAIIVRANLALDRGFAALAAASSLPAGDDRTGLVATSAWRAGDWLSVARAYQDLSPQQLTEADAIRYALAAYMIGERTMPAGAEAALKDSAKLAGLKALFARSGDGGAILERGRTLVESADDEIDFIEGVLSDG